MDLQGKRVFLSGPMTGLEHNNAAAFAVAHAMCRTRGASFVYDPAYAWMRERPGEDGGRTHEDYMRRCLNELTRERLGGGPYYDLVLQLDGWQDSAGASAEAAVARACGVRLLELVDLLGDES